MAIISCKECGKDVSDKAELCPHCGISLKVNLKKNIIDETYLTNETDTIKEKESPKQTEEQQTKRIDEKFCESCGAIIKINSNICVKCGVQQNTGGIKGFFSNMINAVKSKISSAKKAIDEEMKIETGISMPHKIVAVIVALSAGWTGITGLGSIIAGRKKAGFAMLGIPLVLGVLTFCCLMATFFSALASIFIIGIPFFFFFGTLSIPLVPLALSTYIGFYIADVVICIKAK